MYIQDIISEAQPLLTPEKRIPLYSMIFFSSIYFLPNLHNVKHISDWQTASVNLEIFSPITEEPHSAETSASLVVLCVTKTKGGGCKRMTEWEERHENTHENGKAFFWQSGRGGGEKSQDQRLKQEVDENKEPARKQRLNRQLLIKCSWWTCRYLVWTAFELVRAGRREWECFMSACQ